MDIIKILALRTLDYSEQFSEFWKIYWKASWKCFHPKNYRSNITNKGCCGFRCSLSKKITHGLEKLEYTIMLTMRLVSISRRTSSVWIHSN